LEPGETPGRDFYEQSGYFEGGGSHLLDPHSRFHRYRIAQVLSLCGSLEGLRVVDLGSGWGTLSFALAPEAGEVVGVDFADAAVRMGQRRLGKEPSNKIRFLRADAGETGLPAGAWDLVVAADLIEHLDARNTRRVYREARRLLRPGGRFVVWTPNPGHFLEMFRRWGLLRADPTHIDYKTLDRVVLELEAEGFRIQIARYVESHLPGLDLLERVGMRAFPFLRRRVAVAAVLEAARR
jgi:SAM-dependent methyltransferase